MWHFRLILYHDRHSHSTHAVETFQESGYFIFKDSTLCVVGVDAGNAVTPSTGPPTSDGVLYIMHMGDGTIPTMVNNNSSQKNRQSVNETLIFDIWGRVYKNWGTQAL